MSNTVLTIEIEGNNLVSRDKILSVLKNNGITEGKFIPNINFRNVERNVTTSFKNIAFAAVRSKGGRVIVEVDEVEEPPYIIPRNIPCNIVADRDAQLVNASVLDGKLIPKIGEAVKKGDLLVSGTYIDKHNKVTVLHSQAQITGRYNESISFVQPLLEEENKPTGEVINGKDLSFFGIRIPISFNKKIISEYEYEENIQNLSFFSIKLPLSIVHKTYKLIDKQEISYTKETAEIKINEQIENFEKTFYKDKTIVSKEIVKGETENSISFKINYVIEGEIGTKKLFIAK